MSVDVKALTEELRETNPMYHDFVFDEAGAFLRQLNADPEHAPKQAAQAERLVFAAGQGFVTGYGAALDGDYDEEAICERDTPEFALALADVGKMPEWQKARIAQYDKTITSMVGGGPLSYYSAYGFAHGFSKGLFDMEQGSVPQENISPIDSDTIAEICEDAVEYTVGSNDALIQWIAGAKTKKKRNKVEKTYNEIENAIRKATVKFVSAISCGYSGYNDTEPEFIYNRAQTYSDAFAGGFFDGCVGETLEAGDYDLDDVPPEILHPLGAFSSIDAHYGDDLETALLAKTALVDFILECDEDEGDDDEFEMPPYDDAFWHIHGIGYADGALYASRKPNFHLAMTSENQRRLDALMEEELMALEAENARLSSIIGEDGEFTPEYEEYLHQVLEKHVVEKDGKRTLVLNEELYGELGLL